MLKRDTDADVRGLDGSALGLDQDEFFKKIKKEHPDLLVVETPTVSLQPTMKVLKQVKNELGCSILLTGVHVSGRPIETLEEYPFIDFCAIGEYEFTAKDLVQHLMYSRKNIKSVAGLAFHQGDNIVLNPRRELILDLDSLPYPDREDFPVGIYHDGEYAGKPCVQMVSSRGCPVGCSFCAPINVLYASRLYRRRTAKKVVDEIIFVKEKYGAKAIYFDDDTMTIDRGHFRSICAEMIQRKFDINWSFMGDITLSHELLELARKTGCVGLKFGVESITPEALKNIGKLFVTKQKVENFVKMCKEVDLRTHATFIVGLPSDTEEGIRATIKFAEDLKTDSYQVSIATPFPGTPFFNEATSKAWIASCDWSGYDGSRTSVLNYPWLSKEKIEELHRFALARLWYSRARSRPMGAINDIIRLVRRKGPLSAWKAVKLIVKDLSKPKGNSKAVTQRRSV